MPRCSHHAKATRLIPLCQVREAVRPLREVSERVPDIRGEEGATLSQDSPFFNGLMSIKEVSFAYPSRPNQKVLDGCSLTLEPGKTTALVGPSGGGKSTLQLLLARFFDPSEGRYPRARLQPWLSSHAYA